MVNVIEGQKVNVLFEQGNSNISMMDFLTNLLDIAPCDVTALLLGLMMAISPCPLATNITAIGFISKDLENRKQSVFQWIVYTLGRAVTYTLIPLLIFLGAISLNSQVLPTSRGRKS